jgi:hypothetical protein
MRSTEIKICRNCSGLQYRKEMLGRGFGYLAMADEVKGFIPAGALPAGLRRAVLLGNNGVKDMLPSARRHRRVAVL